jgi:hypothetical protein
MSNGIEMAGNGAVPLVVALSTDALGLLCIEDWSHRNEPSCAAGGTP